jgi:hypothetical protein
VADARSSINAGVSVALPTMERVLGTGGRRAATGYHAGVHEPAGELREIGERIESPRLEPTARVPRMSCRADRSSSNSANRSMCLSDALTSVARDAIPPYATIEPAGRKFNDPAACGGCDVPKCPVWQSSVRCQLLGTLTARLAKIAHKW